MKKNAKKNEPLPPSSSASCHIPLERAERSVANRRVAAMVKITSYLKKTERKFSRRGQSPNRKQSRIHTFRRVVRKIARRRTSRSRENISVRYPFAQYASNVDIPPSGIHGMSFSASYILLPPSKSAAFHGRASA